MVPVINSERCTYYLVLYAVPPKPTEEGVYSDSDNSLE